MITLFWMFVFIAAIRYIVLDILSALKAETVSREQKIRIAAELVLILAVVSAFMV